MSINQRPSMWGGLAARTAIAASLALLVAGCGGGGSGTSVATGAGPTTSSTPTPSPAPTPPLTSLATTWRPLVIGAGGFITGIDLNPDGVTRVIRTDTYGGYIWRNNRWNQLVVDTALPASERVVTASGLNDVVSAPSNAQRLYMYFNTRVYRSDNQGGTWTRTSFPAAAANPNDDYRTSVRHIAVDPANPDVLYVGTRQNGLWVSTDGGATWSSVGAVPNGQDNVDANGNRSAAGGITLYYNARSAVVGGRTQTLYAGSWKNGLWRTTNGGTTWSQIAGPGNGPSVIWRADIASDGTVYVTEGGFNHTWRYRGGSWTEITPRSDIYGLAVDPTNPDRVYAFTGGGDPWRTTNGGASWTALQTPSVRQATGDVTWHSFTDEDFMSVGQVQFDPRVAGQLWFAQSIGVWRAQVSDTSTRITWQAESRGIEQLVVNDVVAPPGQKPLTAAWDRAIFVHEDVNAFPVQHGPTRRFNSAWQIDWNAANPAFLVANTSDHRFCCTSDGLAVQAGWSADGGRTWTRFASQPTPPGSDPNNPYRFAFGDIAVSANDTDNIVWLPTFNGAAAYTRNRGASWSFVTLPGQSASAPGSHFANYLDRKVLAADRVQPNTFYLAHSGGPNGEAQGLWRTTDGGANWTRMYAGEITSFSVFNATLKAVPGRAGHLFFTPGPLDGLSNALMRSTDGGATWRAAGNAVSVSTFGFGKALDNGGYPTLYIAGTVNGQYGLYRSTDEGATWTSIGTFPLGSLDRVTAIDGDKERFGRVYLGFSGSGAMYGDLGQP